MGPWEALAQRRAASLGPAVSQRPGWARAPSGAVIDGVQRWCGVATVGATPLGIDGVAEFWCKWSVTTGGHCGGGGDGVEARYWWAVGWWHGTWRVYASARCGSEGRDNIVTGGITCGGGKVQGIILVVQNELLADVWFEPLNKAFVLLIGVEVSDGCTGQIKTHEVVLDSTSLVATGEVGTCSKGSVQWCKGGLKSTDEGVPVVG